MYRHSKLFAILSYITWIGFFVALFMREKDDSLVRRHLNQALILNIASTASNLLNRIGGIFSTVALVVSIAVLVLAIMGLYRAIKMREDPLPLIGEIEIIK